MTSLDDLAAAKNTVAHWLAGRQPELAIILGSGLTAILALLEEPLPLPYREIPGFPAAGVRGHVGCLHSGWLAGQAVLIFQGRYHCYEGYSAWQVTALVRLAAAVGCRRILLTNAAGGIADGMQAGDFMLVTDHLNMTGESPLRGRPEREFVDLADVYAQSFYPELQQYSANQGIRLHAGILAWMLGPNYETPAEIRLLQLVGASAVSMSTIPEAIVARRYGLQVVALSYISNLACGKAAETLDHAAVLASGDRAADDLNQLIPPLLNFWSN
jgi:purine-nucleoside phosphorylase